MSSVQNMHTSHLALATLCLLCGGGYFLHALLFTVQEAVSINALVPVASTTQQMPHQTLAATSTSELRILFVGDMFFDRQIRYVSALNGSDYPFSCVDSLFSSEDLVVGNLEGPITTNKSVSLGSIPGSANNYRFTFPTTTATTLARHNVKVVTLGNNHITNFGLSGLKATHRYLDDAGVGYFGGVAGNEPVYRLDEDKLHLSFVGYNEFGGGSPEEVASTIAAEHIKGREVIVFSHWGVEYSTSPDTMRPVATLFAQNGATVIIGSHPHVVGRKETIGATVVYYSLGNFIFDQYFSDSVRHGLAVEMRITPDGVVGVQEYATELKRDGRTCVVK